MKSNAGIFAILALTGTLVLGACNTTPAVTLTPKQQATLTSANRLKAQSEATPVTYVGKLEGSSAYIAVVNRAGGILVYVCDGTEQSVTISSWYEGTLNDKTIQAKLRGDSSRTLDATLNGDSLTGTVMLESGVKLSFSAALSAEPSGLWQASQADATGNAINQGAWIVLPDGTQHGALKPLNPRGPAAPVGPVKPVGNLSPIGPVDTRDLPGMAPGQPCRESFDLMQRFIRQITNQIENPGRFPPPEEVIEIFEQKLLLGMDFWNNGNSSGSPSCSEITGVTAPVAL
jgi:hypothetical protein